MAEILSDEAVAFCTEVFNETDTDKSGSVDKGELEAALKKVAENQGFDPPTKEQVDKRMAMMDTDGDGTVNLKEFLEFVAIIKVMMIAVTLFDAVDTDKSGSIDAAELKSVLTKLYDSEGLPPPTDEEVGQFAKELDASGDGKIDFDEFATFIIPLIIAGAKAAKES